MRQACETIAVLLYVRLGLRKYASIAINWLTPSAHLNIALSHAKLTMASVADEEERYQLDGAVRGHHVFKSLLLSV